MTYVWSLLDRWLYGPASAGPGWRGFCVRMLRYPCAVVRDVMDGEISLRAMGLVYTTLLSLVPLIAFTLTILKIFDARRDLEPIVMEFFKPLGPVGASRMVDAVMHFADRASTVSVGLVGFALLAWTVVGTIKRVEDSFNFLWRIEQARSLARRVVEYVTLLVIGPLLLVTFITLTHDAQASAPVQEVARVPLLARLLTTGMPYVMVSALFTALYLLIPNTRVQWRPAVLGGLVAGVLWSAVGRIFTAFVVFSARLTFVYASFAFIIAALTWTYLGWLILLAGAQLSFYIQQPAYLRLGTRPLTLSGEELEQLTIAVMYLVAQAHVRGGTLWTQPELAVQLEVPGAAMARTVAALTRAGLLLTTAEGQLVPARDSAHIPLVAVVDAARREGGGAVQLAPPIPVIAELLTTLEDARRHRLGDMSLKDLVDEPRALALSAPRPRPGLLPRA
jgi:membrane protein